uniref:GOLD domain-containing protein n=1 Tax=Maylandia zebra TaxID=106582 RepID=A0A3P9CNU3_9CICH
MWRVKVTVVPVVIGALGAVTPKLGEWLQQIPGTTSEISSVTISRVSSEQLDFEILFPGCVLRWQFASDGGDIGFGVFQKAKKGEWKKAAEKEEIVPSQRYNAHLVPEDGSLTCERPGVYVLRFNNTYSIFQAKRISYSVEVLIYD